VIPLAQTNSARLKITQVRSAIGGKQNQRATLLSLGLRTSKVRSFAPPATILQ